MHTAYLEGKLVEQASPYNFIASQDGSAYTEVCGNMQKLCTNNRCNMHALYYISNQKLDDGKDSQ